MNIHYENLISRVEKAKTIMQKTLEGLPWKQNEAYAEFLAQTYYYVSYTTRHMALAAGLCPLEKKDLHNKLIKGAYEEINHEDMIINDLATLGFNAKDFKEHTETKNFYHSTRELIKNRGSEALLAFSIPIETLSSEGDFIYNTVTQAHGKEAATFLEEHCILDKEHAKENREFVKTLKPEQIDIIKEVLPTACHNYCSMIEKITNHYQ